MAGPSIATIKRLFSESGATCNFTGCVEPVVDQHRSVNVEVCHINAASKGGPRFDASQTDEERHSFENLLLLCPTHHARVDRNEGEYTSDALQQMKLDATGPGATISDQLAHLLVSGPESVVSVSQRGGQTAHTILNVGQPSRSLSPPQRSRMISLLEPYAGSAIGFASFAGNSEAASFKRSLMGVFHEAGWEVVDQSTFMFFGDKTGLVLTIPLDADESSPPLQAAAAALDETGHYLGGNRGDMAKEVGPYVQVWPAN